MGKNYHIEIWGDVKMVGLKTRLKMAWLAFQCKPFEIPVEPYQIVGEVDEDFDCDSHLHNNWEQCHNKEKYCLSRKIALLQFRIDDHKHLCFQCAGKIIGEYNCKNLKREKNETNR